MFQSRPPPRPALTHFLCIPLATPAGRPQLARSLAAFRADVAATPVTLSMGGSGRHSSNNPADTWQGLLPATAVRPVGTLHLTLGVMSLRDDGDGGSEGSVRRAVDILRGLEGISSLSSSSPNNDGGSPMTISLRGLHAMQPPARAAVLYAAPVVDGGGRGVAVGTNRDLLALCERIRAAFAGLLVADERPLLLHATVVNTVYVRGGQRGRGGGGPRGRGGRGGGRGGGGRLTFDARELLDRYDDAHPVWMAHVPVETVALCRMGAQPTAVDADGQVVDEAYPVEWAVRI
ncbi:hypothetical protein SPI_05061 [Niveomyces insectorum RCEF 264]|uniref:A-kinase anchor protein 7-like phosphoesterase domain-containing protein n=1 Tax=Niveomyces insectorum RCEF 264 TaxID=1081102 RepID=A0A167TWY7_9HYPO|nr:hypothetical protein SPI_05061 [Niveomyces insectorum RCEF 264]